MIAPAKIPLIQSAIALSTVSKGRRPLSGEVIDKGFQQVEQKNNVGENFHRDLPFCNGNKEVHSFACMPR